MTWRPTPPAPTSADRSPGDRRRRRGGILPILLLAVAAGVAACGESAGASPGSGEHDLLIETARGTILRFVPEHTRSASPRVRVLFRNVSTEPHNLTFEGLDARTETIVGPGASQVVEVVAPGPGAYPFVCTIHPDMRGELTIT